MNKNTLTKEKSPYLRQHRKDPVHWHTWGPEAFKTAKKENKPILLSVGYSACHWCHVMAKESFSDPQTAELMNRFFVNIKVDKEERPDVDALYQEALHMFGGQGGWPLTMFLTPDSRPFFGGTYFPAEKTSGLPSFREVLWQLANLWRQNPEEALKRSADACENLKTLAVSRSGRTSLPQEKIDELTEDLLPFLDADHGGFGHGAKFPHTLPLALMWQVWQHGGGDKKQRRVLAAGVRLSLERMCQGGLFDHLGGGFYRYCVDREWETPHFEKMLSDNAQMLELLATVWCETRNPLYKDRAEKTANWMLEEMRLEDGGFASALDADTSEGEGRYYTWTPEEIKTVLGKNEDAFMAAYGVSKDNSTPQHLSRGHVTPWQKDVDEGMAKEREKLLKARTRRETPERDGKTLADMGGLAIAALAKAARVFEREDWLNGAEKAFDFICEAHGGKDGGLYHSWCDGTVKKVSFAEDYAAMAQAGLILYEATGERHYQEKAQRWMYHLMERHEDTTSGGFYRTQKDNHDLFTALKNSRDSATPSANGLAVQVLARLYHQTGNKVWQEQAMRTFAAFSGGMFEEVFAYTSQLYGQSLLVSPVTIVIVGDKNSKTMQEMVKAAWQAPQSNKVILVVPPEEVNTLAQRHPAYGKEQKEPTAYICVGSSCSAPVKEAGALKNYFK